MHSLLVQKKLDRLDVIAKIPLSELRKEGKAADLMSEVRKIQMELFQFKSTTDAAASTPRLLPELSELIDNIKKRICESTGEPFFEAGSRFMKEYRLG